MIEVNINYKTFGLTESQLAQLNQFLLSLKVRLDRKGSKWEDSKVQIESVQTTRWAGEE